MIEDLFKKPILIFGCGNTLCGDDGFGPAVVDYLTTHYSLPEQVAAEDVGTGICDFLFDLLLAPVKPKNIFIVDAVYMSGKSPGEIFELELDQIPAYQSSEFSLHQFPSVNLLNELKQSGINVRILAVQAKQIPETIKPGLSPEVQEAINHACLWLLNQN